MKLLKLIEQLGSCRTALLELISGNWKAESVQSELLRLKVALDDYFEENPNKSTIKLPVGMKVEVKKEDALEPFNDFFQEDEEISHEDIKLGDLYINEGLRLLKVLEFDKKKKGIAFQEAFGYVIYIENKNLNTLTPAQKIKDSHGMEWELFPMDLEGVKAVNDIGDEVLGFQEVQKLIDGGEAL